MKGIINEEMFEESVKALTAKEMSEWKAKQPTIEEQVKKVFGEIDLEDIIKNAIDKVLREELQAH